MIARSIKLYWPLATLWLIVFGSAIYKHGAGPGVLIGLGLAYTASLLYLTSTTLSTAVDRVNRFTWFDLVLVALACTYFIAALFFSWELASLTLFGLLAGVVIWLFSRLRFTRQ